MRVEINGTSYEYLWDIAGDDGLRNNFIAFINESFGFDFEKWYQAGYWTEKYEPHVLVKAGQVVSTITVNHMKYFYGEEKYYIQIGGVLTRKEYYKKGLASWLMKQVIGQYKDQCDQIFLFSDDVAVAFYPKMGFEKVIEYVGSYTWQRKEVSESLHSCRKMNIADPKDCKTLLTCYKKSNPFSAFPSVGCEELVVFYGLEFKKDCFYYFPDLEMVVVAKVKKDEVLLYDIYGKGDSEALSNGKVLVDRFICSILEQHHCHNQEMTVKLGFSPNELLPGIALKPLIQKDDTTFLLTDKEDLFAQHQLRFPILSHN